MEYNSLSQALEVSCYFIISSSTVNRSFGIYTSYHLPPLTRFRGSSIASHQDISIEDNTEAGFETSIEATIEVTTEVAIEPDILLILPEPTMEERLEDHKEVIQGMYDHMLELLIMRFEELEEEQKALKDRAVTVESERTNLRKRVRTLEMSELSLRDSLRDDKEAYARVQCY
ncbi:hypothetical protein Tco_0454718 [Tanacetum coccineum]